MTACMRYALLNTLKTAIFISESLPDAVSKLYIAQMALNRVHTFAKAQQSPLITVIQNCQQSKLCW